MNIINIIKKRIDIYYKKTQQYNIYKQNNIVLENDLLLS